MSANSNIGEENSVNYVSQLVTQVKAGDKVMRTVVAFTVSIGNVVEFEYTGEEFERALSAFNALKAMPAKTGSWNVMHLKAWFTRDMNYGSILNRHEWNQND